MKIVLFQPQIPQNTGNIVRTCAVTGIGLVLVRPLGFSTTDRWLKRAGLDYWEGVNVEFVDCLTTLVKEAPHHVYFFSSKATTFYTEVTYHPDDFLVFGSETSGLPHDLQYTLPNQFVTIPMISGVRCLNLATSVGIAAYEAKRQLGFFKKSL